MIGARGHRFWDTVSGTSILVERAPTAKLMHRAMRTATGVSTGETVLDLGCGAGTYFRALRASVGESGQVVGVDNSPGMLTKARNRIAREGWPNVSAEAADATTAELGIDRFDVAFAMYSISAMPDISAVVGRVHDALKPGGRLFVADVRFVPSGRAAWALRLLRDAYRRLAGATGADVVPHLREHFGELTFLDSRGKPAVATLPTPWPPLVMLTATKS